MALGDGIRRNIATVSAAERDRFRDAILELNKRRYPGSRSDSPTGGVTFWFKQDEIHQATHVHGGPAFLPWHRELCNRFEKLLREVDPQLSLHYWDWNTDPASLFTSGFMGSANGDAGEPWLSGKLYVPGADPYRGDSAFDPAHSNPYDPPRTLTRNKAAGAPPTGTPAWPSDADILAAPDFPTMRNRLESAHNESHGYIGGTIGDSHTSFRDPFVFLLHSNVDRLFAMWQTQPGQAWRLDPNLVYGSESGSGGATGITTPMEPWAGIGGISTRPWAPPENRQEVKTSKDPSVVAPPCYDTLPNVPPSLVLETSSITFNDVPQGEKTVRPVVFTVFACGEVHFQITDGPKVLTGPPGTEFGAPLGNSVTVPQAATYTTPKARIWISYKGTSPGDTATGEVKVKCTETNREFTIPISANTIARPRALVALVLDRSNSMSWDGGDGRTRLQVLKDSAGVFVETLQENNAVLMVAFDHDPHDVLPVKVMGAPGDPTDPNRLLARQAIDNHTHNPQGNTAIGDGVERAHQLLDPVAGYDVKAMIVLTDGQETASKYISEVTSLINPNHHIFAIGLGTPEEIQPAALAALAQGHRGTLQMTGILDTDDRYLLAKFYLQILANVTNQQIVEDPDGFLALGQEHRIPFVLNEADIGGDVVLLSDAPWAFDFELETPEGTRVRPGSATSGVVFASSRVASFYRLTFPVLVDGTDSHEGLWHAVLRLDRRQLRKYLSSLEQREQELRSAQTHGLRYNLSVQAYSSLRMRASLFQDGYEPGARLTVRAVLTEYDLPIERRAGVEADLERPDGTRSTLQLSEVEPGIFESAVLAGLAGLYSFRVRARGTTLRGLPFTREQLLSGAVWRGGNGPLPGPDQDPKGRDERLCRLLACLLGEESVVRYLRSKEINTEGLMRCVKEWCEPHPGHRELQDREVKEKPRRQRRARKG
jgi:hypothetical protein